MIKVCYLASTMDNRGGAERVNYQVLTRLPPDKFVAEAMFLKQAGALGKQLSHTHVAVSEVGGRHRRQFLSLLWKVLRRWKHSPPHIVFTGEDRVCMTIAAVGRRLGVVHRYILCFHNTRLPWGIGKLLHPFAVRTADAYVLLSQRNLQFWRRYYPIANAYIIPNGIPLDNIHPLSQAERAAQRSEKSLGVDKFIVGLVTFFKDFKNLPAFVDVAARVIKAGIGAQFVLVGDGPDRPRLEQALDALNMRPHFVLPGIVPNANSWYPLFDIALMTSSSSEAFPLTLIEAMACGLPVVATDIAGIPDIVVHGETGFLASPSEIDKLAQYVVQLARDPELRQRMGEAGRQRALAEFDVQVMVDRYATMFLNVVHQSECDHSSVNR